MSILLVRKTAQKAAKIYLGGGVATASVFLAADLIIQPCAQNRDLEGLGKCRRRGFSRLERSGLTLGTSLLGHYVPAKCFIHQVF